MNSSGPIAIVLAAGKGTRMQSDLPKVLIPVGGRPMVRYVLDALQQAGVERTVVVVGHQADLVRQELAGAGHVQFADQNEQLGTGHAVMMCRPQLAEHTGPAIVVAGDSPLLRAESVAKLLAEYSRSHPACLLGTVHKQEPTGMGRIVRDAEGRFQGIVEEKDATPEQRAIQEINVSTYVFDAQQLLSSLDQLSADNAQSEYYLTDCPSILMQRGERVDALNVLHPSEALSINSAEDLLAVEREMQSAGNAPTRP